METFSYKDALLNKPSAGGPARKYKDHSAMKTAPFISNAFPTDDNEVTGNLTEQNEGDRPGVISVDRIQKRVFCVFFNPVCCRLFAFRNVVGYICTVFACIGVRSLYMAPCPNFEEVETLSTWGKREFSW